MKIEDLHYSIPTSQIDENGFDKEKWHQECPMDYLKAIYILNMADNPIVKTEVFKIIYQVTRLHIPAVLYKYYSLSDDVDLNEKKFQTLSDCKIFMSAIKDFNDPYDSKCFFYDPSQLSDIERLKQHNGRMIDDFASYIRGTALTENGTQSMPMWAHYSNNHAGFCVAYDMDAAVNLQLRASTFPVQYIDERLDISSFMKKQAEVISAKIDHDIAMGIKEITIDDLSMIFVPQLLYNLKLSQWSYEKEFRCSTASNAKGMPYIDATPKAIYIGINCCEENRKKLLSIARHLSIPIYQMKLDEYSRDYSLGSKLL